MQGERCLMVGRFKESDSSFGGDGGREGRDAPDLEIAHMSAADGFACAQASLGQNTCCQSRILDVWAAELCSRKLFYSERQALPRPTPSTPNH